MDTSILQLPRTQEGLKGLRDPHSAACGSSWPSGPPELCRPGLTSLRATRPGLPHAQHAPAGDLSFLVCRMGLRLASAPRGAAGAGRPEGE